MSSDTSKPAAGEGSSASASGEQAAPDAGEQAASAARGDGPADDRSGGQGDDLKDRFRAALQRKHSRSEVNTGYTKGEPKVHEVRESSSRKRQFRRKSG